MRNYLKKMRFILLPAALGLASCSDGDHRPALDMSALTADAACLLHPESCGACSVSFDRLSALEKCHFFDYCDGAPRGYDVVYDCLTHQDSCDTQAFDYPWLSTEQKNILISKSFGAQQSTQTTCNRSGTFRCNYGKTLQKCDGKVWNTVKECAAYCDANYGVCTEELPACTFKPGTTLSVLHWTDGDTLWARAEGAGKCNAYEYTDSEKNPGVYTWKLIRYDIRIHGIDAPECSKTQGADYYYSCIKDTRYTDDNELMGYEAWMAAKEILPEGAKFTITCDSTLKGGECGFDATDRKRRLVYLGYTAGNASHDFSVEMARRGMAFPFTEFKSSKLKEICNAKDYARSAHVGVWSLAMSDSAVFSKMGETKQDWLKSMNAKCAAAK